MKTGVVGLGLIGGSIFKKLMQLGFDVVGISNSQKNVFENITDDIFALKDCDIIFVACPMNSLINKLREIEQIVSENTIVTDCSSLKGFIAKENFKFNFIPSHPMAGTEKQGFENSFAELFEDAKWIITPKSNDGVDKLTEILIKIGAKPIITTPDEHDRVVALVSHMPMVISQSLMKLLDGEDLAKKLASSGFRDMTRLALSNTEMAKDMVYLNHENIEKAILKLYECMGELLKLYPTKIDEIKSERSIMYKDGKNIL